MRATHKANFKLQINPICQIDSTSQITPIQPHVLRWFAMRTDQSLYSNRTYVSVSIYSIWMRGLLDIRIYIYTYILKISIENFDQKINFVSPNERIITIVSTRAIFRIRSKLIRK